MAKVGITENPAERLYKIFNAFENLGETQPLLKTLSLYDDPQTAVAKAKKINEIIFIESVHTPGSAEKNIRTILQIGQPTLPQDFFTSFEAKVPQEKKDYLDVVGKTEWIIMESGLASMLQKKFRGLGGIYESRLLFGIPSGEQLTLAVNKFFEQCSRVASGRGPTRAAMVMAMSGGSRPPLRITFEAINFTYVIQ